MIGFPLLVKEELLVTVMVTWETDPPKMIFGALPVPPFIDSVEPSIVTSALLWPPTNVNPRTLH